MAVRVNVCHVDVLDNPSTFFAPFRLEITFEVFENLPKDLEWKLTYVGAPDTETYDQELDSVLVGPVPEGRHKFVFEAEAPDPDKMLQSEIVGVTVLLLTCSYDDKRFIKIGWFVSNEYNDDELRENPPTKPLLDKLTRRVLNDDVRVTTYAIKWDDVEEDRVGDGEPAETEEPMQSPAKAPIVNDSPIVAMHQVVGDCPPPPSTSEESASQQGKHHSSSALSPSHVPAFQHPLSDLTNGDSQTPST